MESKDARKESANDARDEQWSASKARIYTKYVLPSERNPFSLHFPILRRFISLSRNGAEPVPAPRVEGEGIPTQAASMNVRFMRDIGLLTVKGRGLYLPTLEAIKLVNAMSVSDERARPILRGLLADTWFAELAESLFSQRPLMSEDQFVGELALAAVTDKARKGDALRVIIDYLVYADILNRDEKGLSLASKKPSAGETRGSLKEDAKDLSASITVGWSTFETEDFQLRIRLDPSAYEELMDYLELVKKKIDRLQKEKEKEKAQDAKAERGGEGEELTDDEVST